MSRNFFFLFQIRCFGTNPYTGIYSILLSQDSHLNLDQVQGQMLTTGPSDAGDVPSVSVIDASCTSMECGNISSRVPVTFIKDHGSAPWEIENEGTLKECYEVNASLILESSQESSVSSNDFTVPQLTEHTERIYDRQGYPFRLEFGLILRHTETREYLYFRAYSSKSLFERPVYICRRKDLNRLRLRPQRFNVTDYVLRQRSDTKWKLYLVTNVRFVLYHFNYPLGYAGIKLPDYIKNSKSIMILDRSRKSMIYEDHLYAFRRLAVHQGHLNDQLETRTNALYDRWEQFTKDKDLDVYNKPADFSGLPLHQIAYFERCFPINVSVFHFRDDSVALTVYKCRCQYDDTMYVNQFDHHLSYISNLPVYTHKYQCGTCGRYFNRLDNMKRRQLKCTGQSVCNFKGGFLDVSSCARILCVLLACMVLM